MAFETWLAFMVASAVVLAIPGPTILLVVSYAMAHGRSIALRVAAGVALGDLVAMTVAVAGLGALLAASATAFTAVKLIGAAYLIWLGLRMLRSARDAEAEHAAAPSERRLFWHAAAVTALNPKSIGFFVAFVPQFLRPDAALAPQAAVLIASFVGLATLNALAYALLADRIRARFDGTALRRRMARLGGGVLVAMGVLSLFGRRATP